MYCCYYHGILPLQQAIHGIDEIATSVPQGHDKAATAIEADTTITHIWLVLAHTAQDHMKFLV
jgi:hypothetical protein